MQRSNIAARMIEAAYERLTGRPYWTGRSAAAEFGPPPGAVYAAELAKYSDADLIHADRAALLARARARRVRTDRPVTVARRPDLAA